MIDPSHVPPVADDELLARYVVQSKHYRVSSGTVKQDLFVPHPHQDLSVTRHLQATEAEIWSVGKLVADAQQRTLYGRADVRTSFCLAEQLVVDKAPIPGNPNHANVKGWPTEKSDQKVIAMKLAAAAKKFIPTPLASPN